MTKLIVRPIDYKAPGSLALRNALLDVLVEIEEAAESKLWRQWRGAQQKAQALIRPYLRTDDESAVEDAYAQLSADQFDELFKSFLTGPGDAVPPANASS